MIQLTDINGRTHAIHPDAIARLVEPGTSGKWHGINCYVKTFDGDTIEVRENVFEVMGLIKSAQDTKPCPRPMTHRWGKRINPAAVATLLDEAAIHKMLTPLHMSVELLPLGLFTEDHAEMIAKLINLMAVDSAGKGNGMWQVADAVGQVLIAMQARVDEGKSWNVTATERETLVENIMKMDKHFRTWTVRRFNINAMAVNEINNRAKAEGYKRGQRVEVQL